MLGMSFLLEAVDLGREEFLDLLRDLDSDLLRDLGVDFLDLGVGYL
jgi:hypothetical protein